MLPDFPGQFHFFVEPSQHKSGSIWRMWTGENVQGCDRARYAQIEIFIGNFRKIHVHRSKPWVVQVESLDKILIKLSESFFYRGHADPLPQAKNKAIKRKQIA